MTAPHDAPTAAQLLEAVRELLEKEVVEITEGRTKYHTRVAINVLEMVEREIELGPAQAIAHDARLRALGFESEADLAAAIRGGDLDSRYEEVKAAVLATVREKLEVANPGYVDSEPTPSSPNRVEP